MDFLRADLTISNNIAHAYHDEHSNRGLRFTFILRYLTKDKIFIIHS